MENLDTPEAAVAEEVIGERPPHEERDARPRPMTLFRNGAYVSLGVLAVLAVAGAVYTARGVLIQVLIALFAAISLDPAVRMLTRRGVRRAVMAIPVAAALKVVITERLQARDAAGTDGSGDSGTAGRAESAGQQAPELEAANDAPAVSRPCGPKRS